MYNKFCKKQLWECSSDLSKVAMGFTSAETVIKNARLVNVCTHEIQENIDVAIHSGRICYIGKADFCIGDNTKVIDAKGMYILPGLLDGHIHIESSMMTADEYAKAVIVHGTSGIFHDPHEVTNVLGLVGIDLMEKDACSTPLKAYVTTPSCVPAVQGFEDSGAVVTSKDIREQMKRSDTVGLGEMMNFPGINYSDPETHAIVDETLKADKTVTGHYSVPETDKGLNSYISSGVRCCHESTRREDALAKMRLGMYAMFREGSAWHDLEEVCHSIIDNDIDTRYAVLISDDTHPYTLTKDGHLDHIYRRAIAEGIDPITAIQMLTINCASCFRLDHEIGSITPSKCADIIFVDNLKDFNVIKVMIDGDIVAEDGKLKIDIKKNEHPAFALNTMHVGEKITKDTFKIKTNRIDKSKVRCMEIIPAKVSDTEVLVDLPVIDGYIESDTTQDVLKAFVFERHHNLGSHGIGFVKGFHINSGAMASTVAHDAHNLLVIGTNDEDMALAANTLIDCGGGMVVVNQGKVLALVPLEFAGLMSMKPLEEMSTLVHKLDDSWREIGCDIVSPFMTMATIPLACLLELRLTNRGLVDCRTFTFAKLEVE